MKDMSTLLKDALEYMKLGFSIIPVGKDKKSLVQWQKYQKEKASEEQIKRWWNKWPEANIGIVTGIISGLAVIDIDTEEGKKTIEEFIPDSSIMPIVNTPSGGQHYYFKCSDKNLSCNSRTVPGCDLRANRGYIIVPPSSNGKGKYYAWQEGSEITRVALPELPHAYINYINNSLYSAVDNSVDTTPQTSTQSIDVHKFFTQGRRDNDLFHVASCLIKGGATEKTASQVLKILANNCTPPFPEKEISLKIKSALNRTERRFSSLAQDVKDFVKSTTGHFTSTEIHKSLYLSTKHEKKNVSEILRRLRNEGLIEKYGKKDGCFRRVDDVAEDIDFMNAEFAAININLPFNLHKLINIFPKNIIVIAGTPDAGKTAFLLNVVEMNMKKHRVYYFSSEMAEQELRLRLSKFDRNLTTWKFSPKERVSNFADVIRPDDINIIDYLEVHDDFWRIGGMIREIYDKLNKGISIIAIQKDKNKEYGLGATRGLEKARLYLSMNTGELKIIKAKNWSNPENNPNGMVLNFKLYQGCKFTPKGDWYKPDIKR
jgi:hypothetical protein